jgi:hypothetical protein
MVLPPLAPKDSVHTFNGTVQEVNHEEIVLVNALEQSNVDYGLSTRQRPLTQVKREMVRVPLLGVAEIWAYPPGKGPAASQQAPISSGMRSPSSGTQPPAGPSAAYGIPPAGQLAAPPVADAPVRFDAPPRSGDTLR